MSLTGWAPVALLLVAMAVIGQAGVASGGPPHADKLAHLLEFLLLAVLVTRAVRRDAPAASPRTVAAATVALCVGVGALDEWVQAFQPMRVSDPRDLLADVMGAIAGAALGALIYRRN